jgi:hypothetical protein
MPLLRWKAFEDGLTLGRPSSEHGRIVRDDDYADAARITLERDCPAAPFAITCGIYGWMMHMRFFADPDIAEAEYEGMKAGLAAIVGMIPNVNDPDVDARLHDVEVAIGAFVDKYP